ncbi:diacylglycerol/lipid kinase family protein [Marinoscillum furvescens]|uniref:Diacylglycerol kinase (ATP) n=1 Tax=Marinoscillum furvescens DSM 4134 TaxID=1122208 RepID=A0A3D9KZR1_MARFU|nr:diacylglycerol kinase family protein [Marinoscillum furvescens]RED94067.1 diacylglycerol kinase (ATP) [Marinoscillum furvescens DSM 4134]
MNRRLFIVANPASGSRNLEKILRELVDYCTTKQMKYDVFLTAQSQNGWKTVEDYLDKTYTDLVVVGGDGTINECINGLKYDIPVSIIPNGTGNDFSKTLNIGSSLKDYMQTMETGQIKTIDLGVCNERKFVNGVGVGFDGQIVADMLNRKSIFKGASKYYYYVLRILASYSARKYTFEVNNKSKSKNLILLCVANGTTFGGSFKLTPHADTTDGLLDVCEVGNISGLGRFMNIHRLQSGSHHKLKKVKLYQTQSLRIAENPRLEAHIDGEYFEHPPFEFSVLPKALKVRVRS